MGDVLEVLRAYRWQKPFVPFVIVLKDGRRFQVNRPLAFAFSPSRVLVLDDRDLSDFFPPSAIADVQLLHPVG
jgi:hypothetical protein